MPFRDPLRVLILPPGVSIPPPAGQSAIRLDPDVPEIAMYDNASTKVMRLSPAGPFVGILLGDQSPPTDNEPALHISPNPPGLDFYTGVPSEIQSAAIRGDDVSGQPILSLLSPVTNTADYQGYLDLGIATPGTTPFIEVGVEDFDIYDIFGVNVFSVQGTDTFRGHGTPRVEVSRFRATAGDMAPQQARDDTTYLGLTNTSYSGTAGPPVASLGLSFVAPPSGRVRFTLDADIRIIVTANVSRGIFLSLRLGTGTGIGGGTAQQLNGVASPSDSAALQCVRLNVSGNSAQCAGMSFLATGLTPGNSYNVQVQHHISSATSATGQIVHRHLTVEPMF